MFPNTSIFHPYPLFGYKLTRIQCVVFFFGALKYQKPHLLKIHVNHECPNT